MKRPFVLIVALALACAGSAAAQGLEAQQPVIVVVGRGEASRPADFAKVTYSLFGEGTTEVAALAALAARRAKVEAGLTALAGVRVIEVDASRLLVSEVRSRECGEDPNYERRRPLFTGGCKVDGYVAGMAGTARVAPADQAGNAASLAAELGATGVELGQGNVLDPRALEVEATRVALADARRQAEAVAAAQGVRLGPVIRVQDHEARRYGENDDDLVVTGSRIRPEMSPRVLVTMKTPPVEAAVTFTVVYAIAR